MRLPVPRNRLVAVTLLGAVVTAVLAATLAAPGFGLGTDQPGSGTDAVTADAPTPNANFTPAVQSQSGGSAFDEEDEHEGEFAEHERAEHEEYEGEHEDE